MESDNLTIRDLVEQSHRMAREKGWYDNGGRGPLEIAALIHSEISEFVEEVRACTTTPAYFVPDDSGSKPEGQLIELADAVIRIADYCGYMGWDLESAIRIKMEFNAKRPYKHGKKA